MRNLIIVSALSMVAAPAFAGSTTPVTEDPVIVAPAPVVVARTRDWTGFYGGVQLGYGKLDVSGGSADDRDGLVGGIRAGYDYDFGDYVLGVNADYNIADTDVDGANLARIKLRGGYDLGDGLLYATGGVGFAQAEIGGVDRSDTGWVAGFGYEHMVSDNVSVGGEVLYNQFDDFDNSGSDISGTTLQATVSYRF